MFNIVMFTLYQVENEDGLYQSDSDQELSTDDESEYIPNDGDYDSYTDSDLGGGGNKFTKDRKRKKVEVDNSIEDGDGNKSQNDRKKRENVRDSIEVGMGVAKRREAETGAEGCREDIDRKTNSVRRPGNRSLVHISYYKKACAAKLTTPEKTNMESCILSRDQIPAEKQSALSMNQDTNENNFESGSENVILDDSGIVTFSGRSEKELLIGSSKFNRKSCM